MQGWAPCFFFSTLHSQCVSINKGQCCDHIVDSEGSVIKSWDTWHTQTSTQASDLLSRQLKSITHISFLLMWSLLVQLLVFLFPCPVHIFMKVFLTPLINPFIHSTLTTREWKSMNTTLWLAWIHTEQVFIIHYSRGYPSCLSVK